jgi:hypothetical protein
VRSLGKIIHTSPYLKKRIRGRAIRNNRRDKHQNPLYPFTFAPPTLHSKIVLDVGDYSFLVLTDRYYRGQCF